MINKTCTHYFIITAYFLLFSQNVLSETQYRNDTDGYEIRLPDKWNYKVEDVDYLSIKKEDSFGSGCSLIIEKEELEINDTNQLIEYVKNVLSESEGKSSEYILEKVNSVTLNNEIPATKIYFSQKLKKEAAERLNTEPKVIGKEIGLFSTLNNKSYYLSCLSKPNDKKEIIEEHESIINSFNFFFEK